jgi:dTDP-4-dehydrorhamnose reductase
MRGNKMKVLVLGGTGMLGSEIAKYFCSQGVHNITVSVRPEKLRDCESMIDCKLVILNALHPYAFDFSQFDYVINCIGIIKPQVEKVGIGNTVYVNSVFPHWLTDACQRDNTKLIHITTDCVFSGKKGGYLETDIHDVTDVYGRSKSLGEPVDTAMVIRTSIIGEEPFNKVSLVEWAKSQAGKEVKGFTNHLWNGITTKTYAKICHQIVSEDLYKRGLFHVFSPTQINKANLLRLISYRFDLSLKVVDTECEVPVYRTLDTLHELNGILEIPEIIIQVRTMGNYGLTCDDCKNFKSNGCDEKTCSVNVIGSVEKPESCQKFEPNKD